jgi:hypothetical protein
MHYFIKSNSRLYHIMAFQLKPVPHDLEIPQAILDAKEKGNLAVFIGAGFPRLFGCWGWDQLAIGFVEKCHEVGILNARERANIVDKINDRSENPTDVISVYYKELINNTFTAEIEDILRESCYVDPAFTVNLHVAYSELRRLGDFYVTTNYDQHFDEFFGDENIVYKPDEFYNLGGSGRKLSKNKLYHIHGSIIDIKSIVLTHDHYRERYSTSQYQAFLRNVFCEYNVLFIGYGLKDPDLTNILREVKKQGIGTSNFLLRRYYVDRYDDYTFEQKKFNDCDVAVVSYLGDENDFEELLNVIRSWNGEIRAKGLEIE